MQYLSHIPKDITPETKCIIMLHGVGSHEGDLFELRERLGYDTLIISLRGPFSLGMGRYAWYPVDFSTGKPIYQPSLVDRGYDEIVSCIDEVVDKYRVSHEHIFLMGFSQGAVMSYYTLWRSPEKLGGIIALSGRILDEIDISDIQEEKYIGKRVFIGHGEFDQVMPYSSIERAQDFSRSLGIEPDTHIYEIGHTISGGEIDDICSWLEK